MTNTVHQHICVTATCRNNADAKRIAEKHSQRNDVFTVWIEKNVIWFIVQVTKPLALIIYGKYKDALPGYCNCTCTPISI